MASYYDRIIIPFILAVLLLISTSSYSKRHLCLPEQKNALLQFESFYEAWSRENDTGCCLWHGVTCDNETGDVIGLDLSFFSPESPGLDSIIRYGFLPSYCARGISSVDSTFNFYSFTQFPKLLHLDLSCNNLSGTIPPNISNNNSSSSSPLQNLQSLNLATSGLSGSLNFIGPFLSLKHLDLSFNIFSGTIPHEIAHLSQLVSLNLPTNDLTITSSILELITQNMTQIHELNLEGVRMDAVFASPLLNLSSTLTLLSVRNCNLRGRFPQYIFHLPNLRILDMSENFGLTRPLAELNQSSPLISLDLSSTGFSGNIPKSIGNLKNLENLNLHSCYFRSLIPSSICSLSSLQLLALSGNIFCGLIPQCLGNLTSLQWLDMSVNDLTGPLPWSLNNCIHLEYVNASSNTLSDTSPIWLSRLPNLTVIDLGKNRFMARLAE